MYNELIEVLNKWGIDIHEISFKHCDDVIMVLINGHYNITLNK